MNTPALDKVLMYDGRAPTLQAQAFGAISGHAQTTAVSASQLDTIAAFEKTLFNDSRMSAYAKQGVTPVLPAGTTDAEKRGRVFFVDDVPASGGAPAGRCVHCHSGPMLNETSPGLQMLIGLPAGSRFFTAFTSEFNEINNPVQTYRFTNPDGTTTDVTTPDPGLALQTGNPQTANLFKIPTIWGHKNTAPYFHDNSAPDVDALLNHYQAYTRAIGFDMTDGEKADIKAYLALL
jgi:cytochrome c peroxidase